MRARKGKLENYKVIRGNNTEDPNESGENNLIINDDNSVESLKTGISKSRRGTKQEDNSEDVSTNTQKRKSRRSFPVMDMEESDIEQEGEYVTNTRVASGKRLPVGKGRIAANGANKRSHGTDKTAIKYQKKKGKRGRKQDEDEEEDQDKEEVYEVESIVEAKLHRGKRLFKIRWKGFGPENDSWEPEAKLSCEELIKQYFEENPDISGNNKTKKQSHDTNNGRKRIKGNAQGNVLNEEDGGGTQDYEVEKIMEVHFKKNRNREFLIHWKGFHHSENTWEPEENLNCPELIDKFMAKVDKAKCSSTPELRVNPQHTKHFTLNTPQAGRRLSRRNEGKQRATYYSCM